MTLKPAAPSPVTQTTSRAGAPASRRSPTGCRCRACRTPGCRGTSAAGRRQEPVLPRARSCRRRVRRSRRGRRPRRPPHIACAGWMPGPFHATTAQLLVPPRRGDLAVAREVADALGSQRSGPRAAQPARRARLRIGDDAERERAVTPMWRGSTSIWMICVRRGRPSTCRRAGRDCRGANPRPALTSASRRRRRRRAPKP